MGGRGWLEIRGHKKYSHGKRNQEKIFFGLILHCCIIFKKHNEAGASKEVVGKREIWTPTQSSGVSDAVTNTAICHCQSEPVLSPISLLQLSSLTKQHENRAWVLISHAHVRPPTVISLTPYKGSYRSKGFLSADDHVTCHLCQNSWLEKVASKLMPLTTSQAFGTFWQGILNMTFNLTKNTLFSFFYPAW